MTTEQDEHGQFIRGVSGRFTVGHGRIDCIIVATTDEDLARLAKRLRVATYPQKNKRVIVRREE